MASLLLTGICPTCGSHDLRKHCDESRTCTWVCCRACHSFGEDDGSRWYDARKKEAM